MTQFLLFALLFLPAETNLAEKKPASETDYQREELGVNPLTAPSVADIFRQLDDLRPLPCDQIRHANPKAGASREQMGLIFGGLVADGFLIVECKKKNLVDELGRILLRQARGIGVGDRVMRHSASLTDLAKRGDWEAARRELVSAQDDVEQALIALRDQKMAHLISLGGWLRALEISASAAVEANYTSERASILDRRDLISYFAEEMTTLPPKLAQTTLFRSITAGLDAIQTLLDRQPPGTISAADVKALLAVARKTNLAIVGEE